MTRPGRAFRRLALFAVAGCLAGCDLPHPFADDKPPAALMTIRDSVPVSVAPVEGEPAGTADALAAVMTKALQEHDIAASDRSVAPVADVLRGHIERVEATGDTVTMRAEWRLFDPAGKLIAERGETAAAPEAEWEHGGQAAVARLAEASAGRLAALMQDEAPKTAAAVTDSGRIRVLVRKVSGAPGDGDESLAKAVATILQRQDVDVVEDGKGKPDLYVEGEVATAPLKGDKQHVKIVWHVRRADGTEIGNVGQENDVPKGLLDGPWGDVAYSVAIAAGNGIVQLVARGAPEKRGAS